MSPEVLSTGTILVSLVGLFLSIGVLLKQAASLVMATEAIPKLLASPVASMEVVPEFNPERAPVTTFSPRRAVGLMSGPKWTSDSKPSPERAPVPVRSPRRAPVPEFSPRRAPVPEFSPRRAPVPEFSPRRAPVPGLCPRRAPVPELSPRRAPVPELSPRRAPVPEFSPRRAPVPKFSPRRAQVPRCYGVRGCAFWEGEVMSRPRTVCVCFLSLRAPLGLLLSCVCPYLVIFLFLSPFSLFSYTCVVLIISFSSGYLNPVFSTVQRPVLTSMLYSCVSLPVLCYPVLRRLKTVSLSFTFVSLFLVLPQFEIVTVMCIFY